MKSKGVQEKKLIAKQCESNTVAEELFSSESENITIITTKFGAYYYYYYYYMLGAPPFLGNPLFPTKIKKFTPHSLRAIQIGGC